ncbi:AAA domain-containing protein [Globomyces pollinis-pini]|nr:AAA domain-containing protein [Globomyces pollinis-pini]
MSKEDTDSNFKVICLTGPCGGKTSGISILSDLFQSLGWRVYRVPETATILLNGGVHFPDLDSESVFCFQKSLLSVMLEIEDTYRDLAKLNATKGIKTVIICDRGAMDPSAYMPREDWLRVLEDLKLDEVNLRDNRYDCVVHLVTAAKGAEAFYTLENNATRTEGIELAMSLDDSIMNAWVGHASLQVIDNISVPDFTAKCDRVIQAVSNRLGLTLDQTRFGKAVKKHKFLVKTFVLSDSFPVPYRDFEVEHAYLVNTSGDGTETRIRRRTEMGTKSVHLNLTTRQPNQNGQRVETRRNLLPREYDVLKAQCDPSRKPIHKIRRCFLYKDRYFQLDVYQSPASGLMLLEGYLDYDSNGRILVPDWIECEEVTDNIDYSMYTIAAEK